MSPSSIGKLLIRVGIGGGVLIAALLALPFLIDLNSYKPRIIADVKQATGRDLAIAGPIRLSLLPLPVVTVDGVSFANAGGATDPNMAEMKSVAVWLSLPALLTGTIAASEVTLTAPRIKLEIDATGQPNWAFAPTGDAATPLPVHSFRVEGGTLSFSDARTGQAVVANRLDLTATVASLAGPIALTGSGSVDDAPLKLVLSLGAKRTTDGVAGHDADIALDVAGGRLAYKGTVSELGPDPLLSGKASASAENLVLFVRKLARIAGQPEPHVPPLLAGRFRFEGPVVLSRTEASTRDFTLALGDDQVTGSFTARTAPVLTVDARVSATRLDLDRWLKAIVLPAEIKAKKSAELEAEKAAPPPPLPASTPATTPTTRREPNWLVALNAKLALDVGELIYNRQSVRNIAVEIETRNGAIAVPKFAIDLPGDFVVRASSTLSDRSARPSVSGEFSLDGPKLRETLAWLQVDTSAIPADKLTRVSMRGRMGSRDGDVLVEGTSFELDTLRGRAGITVAFTIPLSVELQLGLGTVDLDAFVPPPDQAAASTSPSSAVVPILALLGPSLGLKLRVERIDYRGEVVSGVDLDVARHAGTLKLNELRIASLAGARLDVRGAVADYWTPLPRANIVFSFEAPDIDRVLKLAGGPPTGFGRVSATGDVAGTWESLAIKRGAVSAMGSTVEASGALALLGVTDGKITSMSYKGSVTADGQPMTVAISADHLAGRPVVTADVKAETLEFDKFLGARAGPRRYGRERVSDEIDTASLRGFDGTFKLATAALGNPARLGHADIAAHLKDGKLTITRLKGGLYGGTLDLSGVVDATGPALSFHLKGEASDLRIGEMMRAGSGTNEMGSMIKVALDGVLNANDIVLRGSGTTAAGLKASLAGGARLGGHVYPSANHFLQMIGAAATGATGGAIDFTLGNIASLFGERGGIGVGNILNAISLVLNRFVNHDDPIQGDIEIARGMLSDRGLRVQGSGATASIHTRTSLEYATTETTVDFFLSEEPSLPYLIMSVRGPLAGPSFSATRGGASDPPGMSNILKDIEKVPSMLPSIPMPSFNIPNPFGR